jgi:hypothetical protein
MSGIEQKLEIGSSCYFEWVDHMGVSLCYTEHSNDHWHRDTETDIDIDEEKAREIILFLKDKFNLDV